LRSVRLPAPRASGTLSFPVAAALGDRFGPRGDRFHSGIDLLAAAGAPVGAAGAGRVTFAGWDPGGYGNLVVIGHANGVSSWYAHMSRIDATPGAAMTTATQVGLVGATGNATGPHLHFEVRVRGAVTDPLAALS
jgi:murein DD-endopeptidase MepM/ murein hydrolase activator NlpD